MIRLIAILESFGEPIPLAIADKQMKRFDAQLQHGETITVIECQLDEADVAGVIEWTSTHLLPDRYYAHLVMRDRLIVMFRHCVFRIDRGDARTAGLCRAVGERIGIPHQEMQFERMFDQDHPDLRHE
ncbi:hypothetical protein [Bradyrhizobium sp. HKCCYLRH1062]|uniref:hypothetical protein n=1 Tax=unclassified Bradyrhizobium TaxID=2631580 RepID=UPI003EB81658